MRTSLQLDVYTHSYVAHIAGLKQQQTQKNTINNCITCTPASDMGFSLGWSTCCTPRTVPLVSMLVSMLTRAAQSHTTAGLSPGASAPKAASTFVARMSRSQNGPSAPRKHLASVAASQLRALSFRLNCVWARAAQRADMYMCKLGPSTVSSRTTLFGRSCMHSVFKRLGHCTTAYQLCSAPQRLRPGYSARCWPPGGC